MNPKPDEVHFWCPRTDMFISNAGDLVVKLDLAELRSPDLEITVAGRTLRITGVRYDSEASDARQMLVEEIPAGPFQSVTEVPDEFDPANAKAAYLSGVLRIVIPPRSRHRAQPEHHHPRVRS